MFATICSLNIVLRSGSPYAAVYADRLRIADGFRVHEVPLADVAAAVYEPNSDGADRVELVLFSGDRRYVFAAALCDVAERNEFLELVNQRAEELRPRPAKDPC